MSKSILLLFALTIVVIVFCRGPQSYTGVIEGKRYKLDRYNDKYYFWLRDSTALHYLRVDQTTYYRHQVGERVTIPNPYCD